MRREVRKGKLRFLETWVFPKAVAEFIQEKAIEFEGTDKAFTHVFCGKSKLGGLRIDIEPSNEPDLVADVLTLPTLLGANSQKGIIADPPWEIPFGQRRYFSYAMRDITKPGGYLIINAPWNPWVKGLEIIEVWKVYQAFNSYRDLVDVWILRKNVEPDQTTLA